MGQPDENDLAAELKKIEEVAGKEAEASKSKKRGRPSKEEDQLFGHRRQTRTVWHCIKLCYLVGFSAIVLLALISLFWNWFAPAGYRWLEAEQLAEAQKFLFSGSIGGVLTLGITKALGNQRNGDQG